MTNIISRWAISLSFIYCGFGFFHADAGQKHIEQILNLPQVRTVETKGQDVAWAETTGPITRLYVARSPSYDRVLLEEFGDTGDAIQILGFGPNDGVIFKRGRSGFDAAHRTDGPVVDVQLAREGRSDPVILLDDVSDGFSAPALSSDGRYLAFAKGGDLFQLDLEKRKQAPKKLFTSRGYITELVFSPQNNRLAFVSNRGNYNRGKYTFVGVYDPAKETLEYMQPGLGTDQNVTWSPEGDRVAFVRFGFEPRTWRFSLHLEGAPFDIMVANAATGEGKAVFTSETGYGSRFNGFGANGYWGTGGDHGVVWLDNNELLFPYEKTGWRHIYAIPAAGGEVRQLTQGEFEVTSVVPTENNQGVIFLSNSEDDLHRLGLYRLGVDTDLAPKRLSTDSPASMPFRIYNLEGEGFVYVSSTAQTLARLMVRTAEGDHLQLSSEAMLDQVDAKPIPDPKIVTITAPDGVETPAIIYEPADAEGAKTKPAVVVVHGGPRLQDYPVWRSGYTRQLVRHYFIQKGYYVLTTNYRGGSGYGLDFREPENFGGRGAGDVKDTIAAARYLIDNYPAIDPDRIGVYGHSYGGHHVTNALARSDIFAAGISSAGVGDWTVEMEKDFNEKLQFNIPERVEIEGLATGSSAISVIDQWGDEPTLFIHGDNDGAAAMQQSLELYMALRRRGIETEAVVFPGESHGYSRHENRRKAMMAIDAFFEKYLGSVEGENADQ